MDYAAGTQSSPGTFNLPSHERQSRFSGWRGGVLVAVACSASVLLLNIVGAIVAAVAGHPSNGIATAYTGDCKIASRWTTAIHLLINILSSLLLGASNYCMQRLAAPTREEVDQAHAKGKWLDIGMPSLRNLSSIDEKRLAIWLLLAMSSIPLHLLYNSVVFETIAANDVDFLVVSPAFFTTRDGWKNDYRDLNHAYYQTLQDSLLNDRYLDRTVFENITGAECQRRYTSTFITSGNAYGVPPPSQWDMSGTSNPNSSLIESTGGSGGINAVGWSDGTGPMWCLSEFATQRCQVQFSQTILYVVIACNTIKVALMLITLWRFDQRTIVTIGDAIESFLQREDRTTEKCCLMSRLTVNKAWIDSSVQHGQRYQPTKRRPWFGALSAIRWIVPLSLYTVVIVTAGYLYHRVTTRAWDCTMLGGYEGVCPPNGFGNVSFDYLLHVNLGFTSIIPYVLLANLPQALISVLYLTYNYLFTAMLANREWTNYAIKRATLRVTLPTRGQRSTYFLSLPFIYSVPLMLASIALHWFVSQSIFVARIQLYKNGVAEDEDNFADGTYKRSGSDLGYSDEALIASIVMGCVLVVTCVLIAGLCTYAEGVPIGGTNSAVISAACHTGHADGEMEEGRYRDDDEEHAGEKDVAVRALQWGVTIEGSADEVGHCCFSDKDVQRPVEGHLYAGETKNKITM